MYGFRNNWREYKPEKIAPRLIRYLSVIQDLTNGEKITWIKEVRALPGPYQEQVWNAVIEQLGDDAYKRIRYEGRF